MQFCNSQLRKLDNGIEAWKRKFEHHKKLYDEQAKRFQDLKAKVEPEIASLEGKLNELEEVTSDLFICPYCSREYKQKYHYDNHIVKCEDEQIEIAAKKAELERLKLELEEKQKQIKIVDNEGE